jgi:hypothetical protein
MSEDWVPLCYEAPDILYISIRSMCPTLAISFLATAFSTILSSVERMLSMFATQSLKFKQGLLFICFQYTCIISE